MQPDHNGCVWLPLGVSAVLNSHSADGDGARPLYRRRKSHSNGGGGFSLFVSLHPSLITRL